MTARRSSSRSGAQRVLLAQGHGTTWRPGAHHPPDLHVVGEHHHHVVAGLDQPPGGDDSWPRPSPLATTTLSGPGAGIEGRDRARAARRCRWTARRPGAGRGGPPGLRRCSSSPTLIGWTPLSERLCWTRFSHSDCSRSMLEGFELHRSERGAEGFLLIRPWPGSMPIRRRTGAIETNRIYDGRDEQWRERTLGGSPAPPGSAPRMGGRGSPPPCPCPGRAASASSAACSACGYRQPGAPPLLARVPACSSPARRDQKPLRRSSLGALAAAGPPPARDPGRTDSRSTGPDLAGRLEADLVGPSELILEIGKPLAAPRRCCTSCRSASARMSESASSSRLGQPRSARPPGPGRRSPGSASRRTRGCVSAGNDPRSGSDPAPATRPSRFDQVALEYQGSPSSRLRRPGSDASPPGAPRAGRAATCRPDQVGQSQSARTDRDARSRPAPRQTSTALAPQLVGAQRLPHDPRRPAAETASSAIQALARRSRPAKPSASAAWRATTSAILTATSCWQRRSSSTKTSEKNAR